MVVKRKDQDSRNEPYLGHVGEIWAVNKSRNVTEDKKRRKERSEIPDTSPPDFDHEITVECTKTETATMFIFISKQTNKTNTRLDNIFHI